MKRPRILTFVMAGGEGARLRPFTERTPKPALPFGGSYRIIDFVLSNLYNSGQPQACVLLQYQPLLLARHLAERWAPLQGPLGPFVRVLTPEAGGTGEFSGTADSVAKGLRAIQSTDADLVAVFAADHVYRMDMRQMVAFHESREAEATVAAVPVPLAHANEFGVICADTDGRIRGFLEKPARPEAMPGDPGRAYASMGNYLFRPDVLKAALAEAQARGESDFGRHVLPRLVGSRRVFAYDFSTNRVPGVQPGEEPGYWRDVGTVDAYVEAQWDLLGAAPRFRLDNREWPLYPCNPRRGRVPREGNGLESSIAGPGAQYLGASVRHSVLQRGVRISRGAQVERCILMEGVHVRQDVQLLAAIVGDRSVLTGEPAGRAQPRYRSPSWQRTPAGILVVPPRYNGTLQAKAAA